MVVVVDVQTTIVKLKFAEDVAVAGEVVVADEVENADVLVADVLVADVGFAAEEVVVDVFQTVVGDADVAAGETVEL